MYNPDGTDSGREWVEVYNAGTNSVDLSQYKLRENETNHKISPQNDGETTTLPAGTYAIIADNVAKFSTDHPTVLTGLILDSAFSLKNDGELIEIVDPNDQITSSVNYSPDWGANGTQNSLQLSDLAGNVWIPADPTPNSDNKTVAEDESGTDMSGSDSGNSTENSKNDTKSTHSSQSEISNYNPKEDLEISIGRNRYVLVNTPVEFNIRHNGEDGDDFNDSDLNVLWSFGDGDSGRGIKSKNIYYNLGEYNVVATATLKNSDNTTEQAVSRAKVYVSAPSLVLELYFDQESGKDVDIMLKNESDQEINVGGFTLESATGFFKIPKDTIISAQKSLILSHNKTKIDEFIGLSLNYPNSLAAAALEVDEAYFELLQATSSTATSNNSNKKNIVDLINKLNKSVKTD